MKQTTRRWIILASPILIVLIGHFAAQLFTSWLGRWAWTGTAIVYWGTMFLFMWLFGAKARINSWFGKSKGSKWWIILAIAIGLIAFPLLFFPNIGVMNSVPLVIMWFLFAVINSTMEETYWRGFLLDEFDYLPKTFSVIYTSIFFIAIHPLMLGVFSKVQAIDPANPMAFLPFGIILVIISLSYCMIYLKTKSLRWPIISHFLSDLGNLSIFVFMNMVSAG